jgi:Transglutaminase-like superfamily
MTGYLLTSHTYVCETNGHAVFLDLRNDKYIALRAEEVAALRSRVRGWPASEYQANDPSGGSECSVELLRTLIDAGVLTQDQSRGKEALSVAVDPVTTTIDDIVGHFPVITLRDCRRFIWAWVLTSVMLNTKPLQQLVRRVQSRKARQREAAFDVHEAHRLMTVYFILRPNFFDARSACLRDSLTFVEFFALNHLYPTWVFGVTMDPFAAHSWVQEGPMVLNDYIPHVTQFKPILAV